MLYTPRTEIGFFNNPLVGRLLGHRRHRTTAGYAHLVEAAETVGAAIAAAMLDSVSDTRTGPTPVGRTLQQNYRGQYPP